MRTDFDLTGNDYVSIPFIAPDGAVDGVNVLHAGAAGLIEWYGDDEAPLFRLRVSVDDEVVDLAGARWRRLDRWLPAFTASLRDGSEVSGVICAAGGFPPSRGFIIRVELDNRGRGARTLRAELVVHWVATRLRIATPRPFGTHNRTLARHGALVLGTDNATGPALAIGGSHDTLIDGADASAANGTPISGAVVQSASVGSARRGAVTFFIGAGREADGALAAALSMKRTGADAWLRQARLELSHILRPAQDHRWADLLNRNLIFNRYYALGRAIDDDRVYLLRSRSPYCPAGALYNEREALFWTLPALVIADPATAREALFRAIEVHSERSGEHTRYLDGGAYDAAFVLDHFLLLAWAIEHYRTRAGDDSVLDDALVLSVMMETDAAAYMRLHPEQMLAATELLPSGDAADYPYPTMGNALLHWFSTRVDRYLAAEPGEGVEAPRFDKAASEIAAAVWQFCTTAVGGVNVLVSSTDAEGAAAVYDDPTLSLALLPFFEFCAVDDPVFRSTLEFVRSERYPLWRPGPVPGLASRSDPERARLSALCADLLGSESADALDRLQRVTLPQGLAAAAWDPHTGAAAEPHDAALAGHLAWALVHAAEPKSDGGRRRKRRA